MSLSASEDIPNLVFGKVCKGKHILIHSVHLSFLYNKMTRFQGDNNFKNNFTKECLEAILICQNLLFVWCNKNEAPWSNIVLKKIIIRIWRVDSAVTFIFLGFVMKRKIASL